MTNSTPQVLPAVAPETEAAKALLEEWFPGGGDGLDGDDVDLMRRDLRRVEQEARRLERALPRHSVVTPTAGPADRPGEPETEAGRRHVEEWWPLDAAPESIHEAGALLERADAVREVLRIEQEARRLERERLRKAVPNLYWIQHADVLAFLAEPWDADMGREAVTDG